VTDLAIYNAPVPDRMRYAEALSGASLLPDSYRGKPANLLLALEYGGALGIAPMVAVQEIHVIKGKPTLSALLQAALVRRAGHKLRVTGDHTTATCQIIRADDPDFTFETTWTLDRAKAAGLLTNDSWRKYPDNMLKARAISECVRNACPDVIAGFGYTPEEMGDDTVDPYPTDDAASAQSAHNDGPGSAETRGPVADAASPDIEDAVVVDEATGEVNPEPGGASGEAPSPGPAPEQDEARKKEQRRMWAALRERHGNDNDACRAAIAEALGREVVSTSDLTTTEMQVVRAFVNRGDTRRVSR
jgi:hypothetical protein